MYLEPVSNYGVAAAPQNTSSGPVYEDIKSAKRVNTEPEFNADLKSGKVLGKTFDGESSDPMYESLRKVQKPVVLPPDENIDRLKAAAKAEGTKMNGVEQRYVNMNPRKARVELPPDEDIDELKASCKLEGTKFTGAEGGALYENTVPRRRHSSDYENWKDFEDLDKLKAAAKAEAAGEDQTAERAKEKEMLESTRSKAKEHKRKRSYGRQKSLGDNGSNLLYEALDSTETLDIPDELLEDVSRDRQGSIRALDNPTYDTFSFPDSVADSQI